MRESDIVENLEKCPSFEHCNKNLCPLDLELNLRVGGGWDKCRYMTEKKTKKIEIKGKSFIRRSSIMPDNLLNFIPESNLKRLNSVSRERWKELRAN